MTALDFNKPIKTRSGIDVEILSTSGRGKYPVIGYVGSGASVYCWTQGGSYIVGEAEEFDLVNVPETIVRYINYYRSGTLSSWASRHSADLNAARDRIACIRVEFTEGQTDE